MSSNEEPIVFRDSLEADLWGRVYTASLRCHVYKNGDAERRWEESSSNHRYGPSEKHPDGWDNAANDADHAVRQFRKRASNLTTNPAQVSGAGSR